MYNPQNKPLQPGWTAIVNLRFVIIVALIAPASLAGILSAQKSEFKCRFAEPVTYITDNIYDDLFAGDLDGDSDVDLIVGNFDQPRLTILRNLGDANFEIKPIDLQDGVIVPLDLFDIDGDHDLDLVGRNSSTTIGVLNNDGSGSFSLGQIVQINDIQIYLAVLASNHADFDNDGDYELVISGFGEGASDWMAVFDNEGGLLQPNDGALYPNSVGGSLSITDIDGDLDLDLVTAGPYGFSPYVVSILINDGTGDLDDSIALPATASPSCAVVADLNGDSTDDVAVATGWAEEAQVEVSFNDGLGKFTAPTLYPIPDARDLSAGDIDADGDIDLVVNSPTLDLITVFTNEGNGSFVPGQTMSTKTPESSLLLDLDGDLDLDLAVKIQDYDADVEGIAIFFNECGLLADVDENGVINLLDLDPFIERMVAGEYQLEADMNCDNAVNLLDVSPFVDALLGN